MRLLLQLHAICQPALLPFNYQYPLSAAICRMIRQADGGFADFLHDQGYGEENRQFKLFTFSDISTSFFKDDDRMVLKTGKAEVIVCFYLPEAAEKFVTDLLMNQQIEVADAISKTIFRIAQVTVLPDKIAAGATDSLVLKPLSPMVTGRKNIKGHYDFRSPEDADFTDCLLHHWLEKYRAVFCADDSTVCKVRKQMVIKVQPQQHAAIKRLVTIKKGTVEETRMRGYSDFRLQVAAPEAMLQLALGAGLGLYNAQGMGCVAVEGTL